MSTRSLTAARAVAREVCARLGIPCPGLELLPSGSNRVFRVQGGRHLIRVAPPGWSYDEVETAVRLTGALNALGAGCHRPVVGDVVVVDTEDGPAFATVWHWEPAQPRPLDWREVGAGVRRFHEAGDRLAADLAGRLPTKDLADHIGRRLAGPVRGILADATDVALLDGWYERLSTEFAELEFVLAPGPVHADIQENNLVGTGTGVVLVDTDGIGRGPREIDLMWAAESARGGRLSAADYLAFVDGYGADIRDWAGLEVMVRLRELSHTTWVLLRRHIDPADADLADRMMAWWREGAPFGSSRQ